jgi:hypothetical protein
MNDVTGNVPDELVEIAARAIAFAGQDVDDAARWWAELPDSECERYRHVASAVLAVVLPLVRRGEP